MLIRLFKSLNERIVAPRMRLGYVILGALTLSACGGAPTAVVDLTDYQQRLARKLEQPAMAYQPVNRPQYPSPRNMRTEVERVSLPFLSAIQLDSCSLGQLVAHRNSALGRLQTGFAAYHRAVLIETELGKCAEQLKGSDPELAEKLLNAQQAKRATLATAKQNALATEAALQEFLSVAPEGLAQPESTHLAEVTSALEVMLSLMRYQVGNSTAGLPTATELEQALETVHQSEYAARLWRTLFEQANYLQQLAPMVDSLASDAGCNGEAKPQRAEILHTVFMKYFVGQIQPDLAGFSSDAYKLAPYVKALESHSELPALSKHLAVIRELGPNLRAQSAEHVAAWQPFFKVCGFTPGA